MFDILVSYPYSNHPYLLGIVLLSCQQLPILTQGGQALTNPSPMLLTQSPPVAQAHKERLRNETCRGRKYV